MRRSRSRFQRLSLLFALSFILVSSSLYFTPAQPAGAANDGYSISNGAPPSNRPSMAVSPDNSSICTTWTTFDQNPNQTYVRLYTIGTGKWSPDLAGAPFNVSQNQGGNAQGNTARCAIDSGGRTHVVWVEYPDGRVRYSMLKANADAGNSANWSKPVDITSVGQGSDGQNPDLVSIFADPNGTIWLTYWSLNNNGVFVRSWSANAGWSGATKVSGASGKHPRIGADNQGYVHVIYQQSGAGMRYSYRDAATGQWNIDNAVPGAGGLIEQSGIAVNRDTGDVHIVLTTQLGGDDNTRVVRYIKKAGRTGTNFGSPIDLTGQGNHVVPRIAWSPSGKLTMVADKRDTRVITIATSNDNGASWSGASDLTTSNNGQWPAVAMDAAGNSFVTYWSGDSIQFVALVNSPPVTTPNPSQPTTTIPVISSVGAKLNTLTSTTVAWTTDSASASRVFYAESPAPANETSSPSVGDPVNVTSHAITLRGLKPGTTYNYLVRAANAAGVTTDLTPRSFTTPDIEIVGTGKSYDGHFTALVAPPAGTTRAEWFSSGDNYRAARPIFSGTATVGRTVFGFAGDVTPTEQGPTTFQILVRYNGDPGQQTTVSLNYSQANRPVFSDVDPNSTTPRAQAIYELAGRGIINGFAPETCAARGLAAPCFGPIDNVARAEAAALVVRSLTWSGEHGINSFPDQGSIDDALWNNVRVLADYGVALGFSDGTYNPTGQVTQGQMLSLISRAMVTKGYWKNQADTGCLSSTPATGQDRQDIVNYCFYITDLASFFNASDYTAPADRRFVALLLWKAVQWRENLGANAASLYQIP